MKTKNKIELNEMGEKLLGNVAFGDSRNDPKLAKLQGAEPGSEEDTPEEQNLLNAFKDWVLDPEEGEENLSPFLKNFPSLAQDYPNIFKVSTPLGARVYRGAYKLNPDVLYELQQSNEEDWREFSFKIQKFYLYKNPIRYEPRRKLQSWTISKDVAFRFKGDAIYITNQDDYFFMNQEFFSTIFTQDEKEIIHIGRTYKNDVYVILTEKFFKMRVAPMIESNKLSEELNEVGEMGSGSPTSPISSVSTSTTTSPSAPAMSVSVNALKKPEIVKAVTDLRKKKISVQVVEDENSNKINVKLEYLSEVKDSETGEISKPFTIGNNKYQMVRALTPDRKKTMGVYSFDEVDESGNNIIYDMNEFEDKIAKKNLQSETLTNESYDNTTENEQQNKSFVGYKHYIVNEKTGRARKFKTIEELAKANMGKDEKYMGIKDFKRYVDEVLFGAGKRQQMKEDNDNIDMNGGSTKDLQIKAQKLMNLIQKKIPAKTIQSLKTNKIAQKEVIASFAELVGVPRSGLAAIIGNLKDLAKTTSPQQQQDSTDISITENRKVIKTIKVNEIK